MMKFYHKYEPLLNLNNSKYEVIANTGGRGSGKTQHSIRGVLLACLQKKKRACFFRETKDSVGNSLMADAMQIIESEFSDRGFTATKTEIKNTNGSYIFYKGLKEVNQASIENIKGIASNTDFFLVDEAQAVSKGVWQVLIPTLRKAGSVLIVCYNRIADNLPVEEELFLDYKTMEAPQGTYFVEVNYPELEDFGILSERFLNRAKLEQQNRPKNYEMIYLNKAPDESDRAVVKNFTSENIKNVTYRKEKPLHLTWDFNVDPMSCILAHKTDTMVFYFDEFILENSTTQKTIDAVIEKYPDHKGDIIINGDASGDNRSTQSEASNYIIIKNALKKHYPNNKIKFDLRPHNPPIKNRIAAFNELVLDINNQRRIIIDKKCKQLLYNIKELKYKEGSGVVDVPTYTQIKTDPNLKYLEHPFDAASYLVEFYFPIKVEKFKKE
jgi:PBSX family phage terminase large subunit